jgi:ribonuclease P/MRP protein subunit POP5
MVGFKNHYLVLEVFLDPNREIVVEDPINISKAVKALL